jgi:hypothetical protein
MVNVLADGLPDLWHPSYFSGTCHIFRGSGVLSGSAKRGGLVVVRDTRKNYDCLERLLLYDLESTE